MIDTQTTKHEQQFVMRELQSRRLQCFIEDKLKIEAIEPDNNGRYLLNSDTELVALYIGAVGNWQRIEDVPERVLTTDECWSYWVLPEAVNGQPEYDGIKPLQYTLYHLDRTSIHPWHVSPNGQWNGVCLDDFADPFNGLSFFIEREDEWRLWPTKQVDDSMLAPYAYLDENQLNSETRPFAIIGSPFFNPVRDSAVILVRYTNYHEA